MAIARITSSEFEGQLRTAILDRNPSLDVVLGPIRDTVVSPVATVLEDQNERIRRLSLIMSLLNVGDFTETELDEFAFNEQLLRRTGTRATTTVFFQARRAPAVDLIVPINTPLATPYDATLGRSILFRTTEAQTLPSATAALYFNAATGFYELEVAVQAISTGDEGNVPVNRISRMQSTIAGFESVINRAAASGGADRETNDDLAERLLVAIPGTDISTKYGIERDVLSNYSDVVDMETVFGVDALLTRAATNAGAVDVYIIGSLPEAVTESQTFLGVGQPIVLDQQPVLSVASVDSGGPAYIQGTDYELQADPGTSSGSTRGQGAVVFLAGGSAPSSGDTVNITYNYNSLLETLMNAYIVPDHLVFGRDLLFRQGTQQDIEIEYDLSVLSGSNATSILAQTTSVIVTFINSLGLGDDVEESDVNAAVRSIAGVDNWVPTVFRIIGSGATVGDISISKSQYARTTAGDVIGTLV